MEPIKFLKDKNIIQFKVKNVPLPSTVKKFRQTLELRHFYTFIYKNNLRKETFQIINAIYKEKKKH